MKKRFGIFGLLAALAASVFISVPDRAAPKSEVTVAQTPATATTVMAENVVPVPVVPQLADGQLCAMSGGGTLTGLQIAIVSSVMSEVSYCVHDPGRIQKDFDWVDTDEANPCADPATLNSDCMSGIRAKYGDDLWALQKALREAICKCWADHPDSPPGGARDRCIAFNDADYVNKLHDLQNNYKADALLCCFQERTPQSAGTMSFQVHNELSVTKFVSAELIVRTAKRLAGGLKSAA